MQTALKMRKAWSANVTTIGYTAKTPTATKPSGSGVFDLFGADLGIATEPYVPEAVDLFPYGTDAANTTFGLRLWGWSRTTDDIWVPHLLADLTCTLGSGTATALGTDNLMVDTITVTTGGAVEGGAGADVISPTGDVPASILVALRGCELIEFDADTGTPDAADCNCLWRPVSDRTTR